VITFVRDNIESMEQLELLALVLESPDKWWDPTTVAATLGIGKEAARYALEHLASRNLLAIVISGDVRYRFQPGDEELGSRVKEFASVWGSNRIAITQIVVRQAASGIRNFAKAFKIGRDADR
jgi:hypothetical protein